MHSNHTISDFLIIHSLEATKQFDGDPLLLALHQGGHDLCDTILVKRLGLNIVDILFVILISLLLTRPFGNGKFPVLATIDTKGLNCCVGKLGRTFGLRLPADYASAVRLGAVARLWVRAVAINIVIENKLLTGLDVPFGEDAHAQLILDHPFVHIAVRIARVVAESPEVTLLSRVYELVLAQGHEIEMPDALFIIVKHTFPELYFVDDLANVLVNEVVRSQIPVRAQTVPFLVGLEDRDIGILFELEALILTCATASTVPNAFHFGRTVDAV